MCFSFSTFVSYLISISLFPGEHSWLLSEPDPGVEVSVTNAGGKADRTLVQSAVSGEAACSHDTVCNTRVQSFQVLHLEKSYLK